MSILRNRNSMARLMAGTLLVVGFLPFESVCAADASPSQTAPKQDKPSGKPDRKPDKKPDQKPDQQPDKKPDQKPDQKPDKQPDKKPDKKPDKQLSGKPSQDKPVQNKTSL